MDIDLDQWLRAGAIASLPNGKVMCGYDQCRHLAYDELSEGSYFYFPDFFLNDRAPFFSYEVTEPIELSTLMEHLAAAAQPLPALEWRWYGYDDFYGAFKKLKKLFCAGNLKKAVPYLFCCCQGLNTPEQRAAALLGCCCRAAAQKSYVYGFWNNEEGMVGATPEQLCQITGNSLQTMACAGTMPIGEALISDPKLLKEHCLVVEGIEEALALFGSVEVGESEERHYPPLAHLVTPIEITLNGEVALPSLVSALHPTPALGTFPKAVGNEWLADYATLLPRRRYGAPAGIVMDRGTSAVLYVAIRNIQWQGDTGAVGIGCGVVAESDWRKEWEEIKLKHQAIETMLLSPTRSSP